MESGLMGKFHLWIFLLYKTKRFQKTLAGTGGVCYNVNTCLKAGKAFFEEKQMIQEV